MLRITKHIVQRKKNQTLSKSYKLDFFPALSRSLLLSFSKAHRGGMYGRSEGQKNRSSVNLLGGFDKKRPMGRKEERGKGKKMM